MSVVGALLEQKAKPSYVRFERIAKEDKAASLREKTYVARDLDIALITPPYSRDVFKQEVGDWFRQLKKDVTEEKIPPTWLEHYQKQYDAWLKGQELPLDGTAIKGWGVISPAQQETLLRVNILTVEDLAGINDEGVRHIGMGAIELKNKAQAWLSQLKDKGPLTIEMAAIKAENSDLRTQVDTLAGQVQELLRQSRAANIEVRDVPAPAGISASDIIPEEEAPRRGPGRPRKDS